jgi:hypothetical protein
MIIVALIIARRRTPVGNNISDYTSDTKQTLVLEYLNNQDESMFNNYLLMKQNDYEYRLSMK